MLCDSIYTKFIFYLYKISRKGKATKTKSRFLVTRDGGGECKGTMEISHKCIYWDDENVLKQTHGAG